MRTCELCYNGMLQEPDTPVLQANMSLVITQYLSHLNSLIVASCHLNCFCLG